MAEGTLRFLTPEWAVALEAAGNASEALRAATLGVDLTLQQVITGGGEEKDEVRYALRFRDGTFSVEWGDVADADVTFVQDRSTAVGLNRGDLNAQLAFMVGKLKVRGDPARLTSIRDAFLELEDVFAGLRERTEY